MNSFDGTFSFKVQIDIIYHGSKINVVENDPTSESRNYLAKCVSSQLREAKIVLFVFVFVCFFAGPNENNPSHTVLRVVKPIFYRVSKKICHNNKGANKRYTKYFLNFKSNSANKSV